MWILDDVLYWIPQHEQDRWILEEEARAEKIQIIEREHEWEWEWERECMCWTLEEEARAEKIQIIKREREWEREWERECLRDLIIKREREREWERDLFRRMSPCLPPRRTLFRRMSQSLCLHETLTSLCVRQCWISASPCLPSRWTFRAGTQAEDINNFQRPRWPFRAGTQDVKIFNCSRSMAEIRAGTQAEDIKFYPDSFPKQKPGDIPVNKRGNVHLGELAENPYGSVRKDPDHDGQGYQDFIQCKIQGKFLDAEAHVMVMTAQAA